MPTLLGDYLNKLGVVKERVRRLANIKKPRMNDLNNKFTAKPSPEEFYRIVYTAIKLTRLEDTEFDNAINAVFPDRPKSNLIEEYAHLPNEIRFLKKHTLRQNEVEDKIGMAENKISRLTNEKTKDLLAVELISFIEGLELDVLKTFKELFGEVVMIDIDLENKLTKLKFAVKEFEKKHGGPCFKGQDGEFKRDYEKIALAFIKQAPVLIYKLFDAMDIGKHLPQDTRIILTKKESKATEGKDGYSVSNVLAFLEKEDHQKLLKEKYITKEHEQLYTEIVSLVDNTLTQINAFEGKYIKEDGED